MSNLLAIEFVFAFTQKKSPENSKKGKNSKNSTWRPNYHRSLPCLCLHFPKLYKARYETKNILKESKNIDLVTYRTQFYIYAKTKPQKFEEEG